MVVFSYGHLCSCVFDVRDSAKRARHILRTIHLPYINIMLLTYLYKTTHIHLQSFLHMYTYLYNTILIYTYDPFFRGPSSGSYVDRGSCTTPLVLV